MLDSDAPAGTQDAAETAPVAPRRRRAASRPAGPPAPAPVVETATEAALPEAALPEAALPDVTVVQAPDPEPESRPAPVRRSRRATRVAGPAAKGSEPVVEEVAEAKQNEAPPVLDAPVPDVIVLDETGSAEPARRPARRSRRRTATAPQVAAPTLETEVADTAEPALEPDPVLESLAELQERPTRARLSEKVASPFSSAEVSAALDNLAAVIGGGTADEALAEDEDADDSAADEPVEDEALADAEEDSERLADDDDSPRRRRRRRGGRRRRRGSSDEQDGETDGESEDAEESPSEDGEPDGASATVEAASESSGRRRRRRRRRGEDTSTEDEDGVDVVVKVREPRRQRVSEGKDLGDQITSIEGSTRMEAKKQRRREGRAAGRRRAPILSEAEFLARRESVLRQMLIRQADDYTQIAVLEDGVLVEHYVDRDSSASMIGNVYLGRVQNVLPSMEAAFIDIGRGRNAVVYAGEIDWEAFGVSGAERKVEKVFKSGQAILVQVTKDPVGAKGARLTSHISIPGRYVVYAPGGHLSGISRKLSEQERNRLKNILDEVVDTDASVIVRTAAEGASEEELVRDVNRLKAQWEVVEKKVKSGQAPQLLYSEPDLTVRIVRDLFTEDFTSLIVDGNGQGEDAFETVQGYVTHVAPHLQERLRHWDRATEGDLYEKFRVNEQVSKALERKVHLPSGGSLVIDRTEAMTVVDVNTGKFTGTQGNLEATVTSNNLEAAEEIVRQLRLRDIGGIIVIDFIDMVLPANRELLLRRLVECLGRDRTRHQVAEVTSLGLVQMTRKKIGTGLLEAFTVPCENCQARGYHVHESPVATQSPTDGGDRHDSGRRGRGQSRGANRGDSRHDEQNQEEPQGESRQGELPQGEEASEA